MSRRTAAWAAALVVAGGIAAWLVWSPLGANELVGGDEGYYGVMARSALASPRHLLSPPLTPLGPPGDKPPLYPALLALSIRVFGATETALRWPSIAAAALIALALARMLARGAAGARPAGSAAGTLAAAAFFVSLPWLADASRVCAAEPALTAFGAAALWLLTGKRHSRERDAAAGALLGCAFLCKLWLAGLVALPAAVAVTPWTRAGARRLAVVASAAAAVASLQLAAVAIFQPPALRHWLGIYLGFSLAGRASGEGFAGYWLLPPAAYWTLLAHALVLLMPLVAIGVEDAIRRRREPVPLALLAWAAGVAVISGFAVKTGGYAYAVMPAWVGLAALGLASLAEGRARSPLAPLLGAALTAPPLIARLGGSGLPAAPWLAAAVLTLAAWSVARARPVWAPRAALALALAIVVAGFARESRRLPQRYHVPGYRTIAAAIAPRLAGVPAARACFVAPEAPAFAFRLFRTGRYWGTPNAPWSPAALEAVRADTALRVFVVDTTRSLYGGWPDSATVAWLEREADEWRTASSGAGGESGLRVFFRR